MKGGSENGFDEPVIIAAPIRGTCPMCAMRHAKAAPHYRNSIYYQVRFRQMYGRAPTQEDAMMHCVARVSTASGARKKDTEA